VASCTARTRRSGGQNRLISLSSGLVPGGRSSRTPTSTGRSSKPNSWDGLRNGPWPPAARKPPPIERPPRPETFSGHLPHRHSRPANIIPDNGIPHRPALPDACRTRCKRATGAVSTTHRTNIAMYPAWPARLRRETQPKRLICCGGQGSTSSLHPCQSASPTYLLPVRDLAVRELVRLDSGHFDVGYDCLQTLIADEITRSTTRSSRRDPEEAVARSLY